MHIFRFFLHFPIKLSRIPLSYGYLLVKVQFTLVFSRFIGTFMNLPFFRRATIVKKGIKKGKEGRPSKEGQVGNYVSE